MTLWQENGILGEVPETCRLGPPEWWNTGNLVLPG